MYYTQASFALRLFLAYAKQTVIKSLMHAMKKILHKYSVKIYPKS